MKDVLTLSNKDTGDIAGDASFVLSRRTTAFECRKDPNNFMCKGMASLSGDDANSTDLVLEMNVEVDGQWGPYLLCNPVNGSKPEGPWECLTHLLPANPPNYPATCHAENVDGISGYCLDEEPKDVHTDWSLADCC